MIPILELEQLSAQKISDYGVVHVKLSHYLTPDTFLAIASRLGKPVPFGLKKYCPEGFPPEVTLIDTLGDGMTAAPRGFGEGWHQDSSFLPDPPAFTVLHAYDIPSRGGDTLFADTRKALATLCPSDIQELRTTTFEHSVHSSYRITSQDVGLPLEEVRSRLPKTHHPAIMAHPRGGSTLWISPLYVQTNLQPQTKPLFDRVLAEILKHQIVHQWSAYDLILWDNRVVLHAASAYNGSERRRLIRTVVEDRSF